MSHDTKSFRVWSSHPRMTQQVQTLKMKSNPSANSGKASGSLAEKRDLRPEATNRLSYSIAEDSELEVEARPKSKLAGAVEEQHRILTEKITGAVRQGNEAVVQAGQVVSDIGRKTDEVVKQIESEAKDMKLVLQKVIDDVKFIVSEEGIVGQSVNQVTVLASSAQDVIMSNLPDMDDETAQNVRRWSMMASIGVIIAVAVGITVNVMRRPCIKDTYTT